MVLRSQAQRLGSDGSTFKEKSERGLFCEACRPHLSHIYRGGESERERERKRERERLGERERERDLERERESERVRERERE